MQNRLSWSKGWQLFNYHHLGTIPTPAKSGQVLLLLAHNYFEHYRIFLLYNLGLTYSR